MPKALLRSRLLSFSSTSGSDFGPSALSDVSTEALETGNALCSEESLSSWFDPLDIVWDASPPAQLRVLFPHRFFGELFASHFQVLFERAVRLLWGESIRVAYGIAGEHGEKHVQPAAQAERSPHAGQERAADAAFFEDRQKASARAGQTEKNKTFSHPALANPFPFGEERTFDTFIANGKHKWALTLARDLARRAIHGSAAGSGANQSSPEPPGLLVLCGGHGTGKTHLLCSVGNELFRTLGRDLYLASIDDLMARFVNSSGADARVALRRELEDKRALLIDDVQRLSPAEAPSETPSPESELQNELCLLFDRFLEQGKAVVVAGAGHPRDWRLAKGLHSRLETGLWAELPEPDLDVRLRYAQQQAKLRRLPMNKEQVLLLAQHCVDIRRLSGLIRRVASHRALLGRDMSEQDILNIIRQGADSSALTAQSIISIVGEYCGVPAREILGEKRRPDLVQARQMAMYLCRELLGHSYPVIGRMFGGKDHSTVMHGVKKIKQLQDHDRIVHTMVTELTKACREHHN